MVATLAPRWCGQTRRFWKQARNGQVLFLRSWMCRTEIGQEAGYWNWDLGAHSLSISRSNAISSTSFWLVPSPHSPSGWVLSFQPRSSYKADLPSKRCWCPSKICKSPSLQCLFPQDSKKIQTSLQSHLNPHPLTQPFHFYPPLPLGLSMTFFLRSSIEQFDVVGWLGMASRPPPYWK